MTLGKTQKWRYVLYNSMLLTVNLEKDTTDVSVLYKKTIRTITYCFFNMVNHRYNKSIVTSESILTSWND